MNNTVTLYKIEYNLKSYNQPYFLSESSRDNALDGKQPYVVPLNQPNIHFDYNLDLELVLPLDYTVAQSYNFARISYNSKDYFAYIVDMQQISVGNIKCLLHRAVLFENPNFLSLFKNFQISRSTFSNDFNYNKLSKYFKPTFRYYSENEDISSSLRIKLDTGSSSITDYGFKRFVPCIVLFLDENYNPQVSGLTFTKPSGDNYCYGVHSQYKIIIIPLWEQNLRDVAFYGISSSSSQAVNYRLPTSYQWIGIDDANGYFKEFMDSISPSIISAQYISLPFFNSSNYTLFPFMVGSANEACLLTGRREVSEQTINYIFGIGVNSFSRRTSDDELDINQIKIFSNIQCKNKFGEITLRVYSSSSAITFDKSNILDDELSFYIEFSHFITPTGFTIFYTVNGNNNSIFNDNVLTGFIETSTSYTYLVDSESLFDAQNRYYEEMTANAKRQKIIGGAVQIFENFGLGAIQLNGASFMEGNQSTGLQTAGFSNITRGSGNVASTINDVVAYQTQRDLYRKNEQAKPDKAELTSDSFATIYNALKFDKVEQIPFESDYNEWLSNYKIFGCECAYFVEELNLQDILTQDGSVYNFFLKCTAILKESSQLDNITYTELFDILKNGCLFKYYP